MSIRSTRFILGASVAAALAAPGIALAHQTAAVGPASGTFGTSVNQDFQIVIPRFIQFRVGAAGGTVSLVNCDMTTFAGSLGDTTDQACTGGDVGGGQSTVIVRSNAGVITLTATTTGALSNGTDTIPFSEILTSSSTGNVPAPSLPAAGGTSSGVAVAVTGGNITNRSATWTYTYDNSAVYAAGTYGGVNVNNGRVTYTATAP